MVSHCSPSGYCFDLLDVRQWFKPALKQNEQKQSMREHISLVNSSQQCLTKKSRK